MPIVLRRLKFAFVTIRITEYWEFELTDRCDYWDILWEAERRWALGPNGHAMVKIRCANQATGLPRPYRCSTDGSVPAGVVHAYLFTGFLSACNTALSQSADDCLKIEIRKSSEIRKDTVDQAEGAD